MKKTKRAVSLLLVLAMIVAMFTVGLTQTGAAGYDGPPILGDVDGDGSIDAMVGVIKKTRFYPMGKRLFIFVENSLQTRI